MRATTEQEAYTGMEESVFHFVSHYGYIGIYLIMALGLIGLPVPDEMLMMFVGYLDLKGDMHIVPSVLVSAGGSVTGMFVSFLVGEKLGRPFIEKHGRKIHMTPERLHKVEGWFTRFGEFAVVIGYFIPGVRHVTSYFAGISNWPYRKFLLYAIPGGLLWTGTFITLGRFVGHHWHGFAQMLHHYMLRVTIVLALGIAAWLIVRWRLRVRKSKVA